MRNAPFDTHYLMCLHRVASLDWSMETDLRKLPIWTEAIGHSAETWDSWKRAVFGYVGGKGLSLLL